MAHERTTFFKIDRKLIDGDWWLSEPFTKPQAWVDLIGLANYGDVKRMEGDQVVTYARGQVVTSERTLAARWKWSREKVRNYLAALASDSMATTKKTAKGIVISLENYGFYQDTMRQKDHKTDQQPTTDRPLTDHKKTENKKSKKSKKSKEEREGLTPRGPYGRVTLSDGDFEKFLKDYPEDGKRYIEELDAYMEQTGKDYRNCLPALYKWAKREADYKARHPEPEEPEGGFTFGWANFGKEDDET